MPHNYKMIIAYDGTGYCGWQVQPNGLSIQEVLQKNMGVILRREVSVIGSGRTDAGVHAAGQAVHFHFPDPIDLYRFSASINGLLPSDIRVNNIVEVPMDFHARYSAVGKVYHYHLYLERILDPFRRLYCWHIREKTDVAALKHAANLFVGVHDFTSFANESHTGCAAHDPVRNLRRLDVVEQPGGVRLEFEGDGFLYKMVRNITGTLFEIACGKRAVESVPDLLAAKDRKRTGQAAPPQGLFLMRVDY
jgi:tRNA pseudouridine38-40 synthase